MAILNDVIIDMRNDRIISLGDFKDEISYDFEADKDSSVYLTFCEYIDEIYSASEIFRMDDMLENFGDMESVLEFQKDMIVLM